jgi:hypothetical protein
MIPADAVRAMRKLADSERQYATDYEALAVQLPARRDRYLARAARCRQEAAYYDEWASSAETDVRERAA